MPSNGESSALQSKRLVARPTKGEGRVGDTETDLCDDYHRPLPAESVTEHTFCSARSFETPMVSITTIVLVMLAAVLVVAGIVLSERAH